MHLEARTVNGHTLGDALEVWEQSERRQKLRQRLEELDGIRHNDVIMCMEQARQRGLTSTITFLTATWPHKER